LDSFSFTPLSIEVFNEGEVGYLNELVFALRGDSLRVELDLMGLAFLF